MILPAGCQITDESSPGTQQVPKDISRARKPNQTNHTSRHTPLADLHRHLEVGTPYPLAGPLNLHPTARVSQSPPTKGERQKRETRFVALPRLCRHQDHFVTDHRWRNAEGSGLGRGTLPPVQSVPRRHCRVHTMRLVARTGRAATCLIRLVVNLVRRDGGVQVKPTKQGSLGLSLSIQLSLSR